MCVTNIYIDVYPDGQCKEFRQTSICQFGYPGRPCNKTTSLENPSRKIGWGEPSTEYILTSHARVSPATVRERPTRSFGEGEHPRQQSGKHRKERIIIVDAPPVPHVPPEPYNRNYIAPKARRARIAELEFEEEREERKRMIDAATLNESSIAEFDAESEFSLGAENRARMEAKARRDVRIAELEAEKGRNDRIQTHNDAIQSRPAVSIVRNSIDRVSSTGSRKNSPERVPESVLAARLKREAEEEEAMRTRLRERMQPVRRYSEDSGRLRVGESPEQIGKAESHVREVKEKYDTIIKEMSPEQAPNKSQHLYAKTDSTADVGRRGSLEETNASWPLTPEYMSQQGERYAIPISVIIRHC